MAVNCCSKNWFHVICPTDSLATKQENRIHLINRFNIHFAYYFYLLRLIYKAADIHVIALDIAEGTTEVENHAYVEGWSTETEKRLMIHNPAERGSLKPSPKRQKESTNRYNKILNFMYGY